MRHAIENHQARAAILSCVAMTLLALSPSALAQPEAQPATEAPSATEAPAPAEASPDAVDWDALAQIGMVLTTGNSRSRSLSGAAKVTRKANKNKLGIELGGVYARTSAFLANDTDGDGDISEDELDRESTTIARAWAAKARYDRLLTEMDALYAAALASGDEPSGKTFVGGAQVGYSRFVIKRKQHELVAEAGYDFSYEDPVVGDGFAIHSARFFAGYLGKYTEETSLEAAVEALFNLNELDSSTGPVDRLEDTRINGKLAVTSTLYKSIHFRFGFEARYDRAPSALPPLAIPFEAGFVPEADTLDTKTEAALLVNFL